ncbi:MAG: hypothetical protein QM778_33270 [Myxococcales bacterium]
MWVLLLVMFAWAAWATIGASGAGAKVRQLSQELDEAKKKLAKPRPTEDEENEAIRVKYNALRDEHRELFTQALDAAEKHLRESDMRLGDADVVDTVELTRNEIRAVYRALELSAELGDKDFCRRVVDTFENWKKDQWAWLLAKEFKSRVRSIQMSDLAVKIRSEAEARWQQERDARQG